MKSEINNIYALLFDQDKPFSSWTLQGLYGAPTLLFENISTHLYLHNHFRELYPGTLIVANSQTAAMADTIVLGISSQQKFILQFLFLSQAFKSLIFRKSPK